MMTERHAQRRAKRKMAIICMLVVIISFGVMLGVYWGFDALKSWWNTPLIERENGEVLTPADTAERGLKKLKIKSAD